MSIFECEKNHLKRVNKNKPLDAASDIPAWALKDGLNFLAELLCFMIIDFIGKGFFPDPLKQAHVIVNYKLGNNLSRDNYRPLSITFGLASF